MKLNTTATPPKMTKKPHTTSIHGYNLEDPYFWFRNKEEPEVLEHLKAENAFTESVLKPEEERIESLWKEIKSRIKEEDETYPTQYGDYFYYSKELAGKEHTVYCRRKGSMAAPEEVILDVNELAEGKSYMKLGAFDTSPDNKILAYSTDTDGSEKYTLYFKNLESGEMYKETLEDTYYGFAWGNDSQTIYVNKLNEKQRPDKVVRYRVGTNPSTAEVVYQEKSDEFFVSLYKTRSENYIIIDCHGSITSENHFIDANDSASKVTLITPRKHGVEYGTADAGDGKFFILTNHEAKNFKVVSLNAETTAMKDWQDYTPHDENIYLNDIDVFKNHIVFRERENGLIRLRVQSRESKEFVNIELPEENSTKHAGNNPKFDSKEFRFHYTSLITPPSLMAYSFADGQIKTLKTKEVPNYDKEKFVTERIFAKGHDGAEIPVSLIYKKGTQLDGSNPCYLYGYGSYSMNIPPTFSGTRFSLVDRGFVLAIAHIRGSSTMGRDWYENGKLLKKKNTFQDFISCAETLIEKKYTSKGEIAICGGSAGGLLMGAVANMRPELFKVVAAHVPFVDVVNTMLDDSLPLTTLEYDEWGNPNEKEYFDYIRSYSPYDNVEKKAYPHIFITAGLNDPRVTYWEPAKWAVKLRENNTADTIIALKTNLEAGHGGKSGRFEGLKEYAQEYAFILAAFNI